VVLVGRSGVVRVQPQIGAHAFADGYVRLRIDHVTRNGRGEVFQILAASTERMPRLLLSELM